jgi:hypothetical protein
MSTSSLTRRAVLKAAAITPPVLAAGSLAAPFVHGAYAAGTLSMGTWDHWVPGASQVLGKICQEWAAKEKVELKFDLITSNGDKDLLTLMAEGQAKTGHDIMGLRTWYVYSQVERFVPVDEIVKPMLEKNGKIASSAEYCANIDGRWLAVPTCYGSSSLPPVRSPALTTSRNMPDSTCRRCTPVPTPSPTRSWSTIGPGTILLRLPRNAPRAGTRSAWGSAPAPTRSTSPAR